MNATLSKIKTTLIWSSSILFIFGQPTKSENLSGHNGIKGSLDSNGSNVYDYKFILQKSNQNDLDGYNPAAILSSLNKAGADTVIAGFDNIVVVANANGSCTESAPCQGAQDWGAFPITNTGRKNQSDGTGWFFHSGLVKSGYYRSMLNKLIRYNGWNYLANKTFEYRWTYATDNYAYSAYPSNYNGAVQRDGSLIRVGFEIWNVTDGYRIIPWLWDYDQNKDFGLMASDHLGSSGDNDPYTDLVYMREPLDKTPGESGYNEWLAASIAAGGGAPDSDGNYVGSANKNGADYYSSKYGPEIMARNIWYARNLDDVSDGTIDAYSGHDENGDGVRDNTGLEKGSVVRIVVGKPSLSPFNWTDSILAETINIDHSTLSDTVFIRWKLSRSNTHEIPNYKLYIDGKYAFDIQGAYTNTDTGEELPYINFHAWFKHKYFIDKWDPQFQMLSRKTFKFDVWAHMSGDSIQISGDRSILVNRYDYLSIEEDGLPNAFALHENYPNPFNPTTALRFDLPEASDVSLIIYNMLGQKVKSFKLNETPAGFHSITWDGTNNYGDPVGAGVYLYQLRTNRNISTRKMVLLK